MGIIDRFLSRQINRAIKAANFGQQYTFIGGFAIYPDIDFESLLDTSFNSNVHFYSIIKTLTRKFASVPRYVYAKGGKEAVTNELALLIENPNEYMGGDEFMEAIMGYYSMAGEAFIWKNRGGIENGRVLELYVLPPQFINHIGDPNDVFGVLSWEFDVNGVKIPIPKEDIIHWKTFNPNFDASTRTHLRGFSPLTALSKTITQSNDATDAQVAMMQNGGAKGVLYNESLDQLTPTQESQLRGVIDKKINNKSMKAAVASLQGKWGYLSLGANSIDMQLIEANESSVKALCNAMGVPYELFQSDTTFANKEQALIYYVTNTMMPLAASLDSTMSRGFKDDFSGNWVIKSDFSELPEMATLNAKLVDAASKAWWKTPDEKRVMTNDEPIGSEEMSKIWIPSGFTPIEQANEPIMPDLEIEEDM